MIEGDTGLMPHMNQLGSLILAPEQVVMWGGADRKAFFYTFAAPPCWRRWMALGPPVPSRLVGGDETL